MKLQPSLQRLALVRLALPMLLAPLAAGQLLLQTLETRDPGDRVPASAQPSPRSVPLDAGAPGSMLGQGGQQPSAAFTLASSMGAESLARTSVACYAGPSDPSQSAFVVNRERFEYLGGDVSRPDPVLLAQLADRVLGPDPSHAAPAPAPPTDHVAGLAN